MNEDEYSINPGGQTNMFDIKKTVYSVYQTDFMIFLYTISDYIWDLTQPLFWGAAKFKDTLPVVHPAVLDFIYFLSVPL